MPPNPTSPHDGPAVPPAKVFTVPEWMPADAPIAVRLHAAAAHDPPPGSRFVVSARTLDSCAEAAERAGDRRQALWLQALAANQRRLELVAAERGYVLPPDASGTRKVTSTTPDVVAHALSAAVTRAVREACATIARTGEPYLSIDELCTKFKMGRTSFYELLPEIERAGLVVRVPPPGGVIRVPAHRFAEWLHGHSVTTRPDAARRGPRKNRRTDGPPR